MLLLVFFNMYLKSFLDARDKDVGGETKDVSLPYDQIITEDKKNIYSFNLDGTDF